MEPVGIPEAARKITQPITNTILHHILPLLKPTPVAFQDRGVFAHYDWRFCRVQRGKHPGNCASSGVRIGWQQAIMALRDVEDNGS